MKASYLMILCFLLSLSGISQTKFIKELSVENFGSNLRILPSNDLGWVLYSKESLRISKFNLCGEEVWSKQLEIPNVTSSLNDIIATSDGGFVILSRKAIINNNYPVLTKLDQNGEITWSTSYSNANYDYFPYTITEDQNGNLIIFANVTELTTNNVFNVITKVSSAGNFLQAKFYNHGGIWGGAISTSDNGVLFRTGSILVKLNSNLDVQWSSNVAAGTYHYNAPTEVENGYIFSGYNQGSQLISYYKLSLEGNLLWGGRKTSDMVGTPMKLRMNQNGNLSAPFIRTSGGNTYITALEFDSELNVLNQNSLANSSLVASDMCFISNGNPIISGISGSKAFFARLDNDFNSGCDIQIEPVQFNLEPVVVNAITTISNELVLTANNSPFSFTNLDTETASICSNIKFLNLGNDTLLCDGESMVLENQTGDVFDLYQWSTGETTPSITINDAGIYWLLVEDFCDVNRANDTIFIEIIPAVKAELGNDLLLCEDSKHIFYAPACNECSFAWSNGSIEDSIIIDSKALVWLEITNSNGCISIDSVDVDYGFCECNLYLPNSFSPNGDGLNEKFGPKYFCDVSNYSFQIFDRWGEELFSTNQIDLLWDGTFRNQKVPIDIYSYVIKYSPVFLGKKQNAVIQTGMISLAN